MEKELSAEEGVLEESEYKHVIKDAIAEAVVSFSVVQTLLSLIPPFGTALKGTISGYERGGGSG